MATPRGELRQKIVDNCCEERSGAGLTRRQIADCVGLKKSPHLYRIINELVQDGWLIEETRPRANGSFEFVYHFYRIEEQS